jgi:hypothetical protein
LYDVSSFATHTMVPSLASDGQVNEFECNFDLQKKKKKIVNNHTNINKRSNHLSYL